MFHQFFEYLGPAAELLAGRIGIKKIRKNQVARSPMFFERFEVHLAVARLLSRFLEGGIEYFFLNRHMGFEVRLDLDEEFPSRLRRTHGRLFQLVEQRVHLRVIFFEQRNGVQFLLLQ